MSKFNDILKRHGILLEQPEATDQPAGTPESAAGADQTAIPTEPSAQPAIDDQQIPPSDVKKLSPASFVWLVTVLKNAFLAHPELNDQKTVAELKGEDGEVVDEINPENAQEVLDTMWPIISKYMPGELKTNQQADQSVAKLLQKV